MDKHRSSTPERHNSGIIRDSSISNRLSQVDDDDAVQEAPAGHETASIKLAALSNQGSGVPRASSDIGASPSNILAQVFSRFSTRNLPEPPPPPDGGLKAVSISLSKPWKTSPRHGQPGREVTSSSVYSAGKNLQLTAAL